MRMLTVVDTIDVPELGIITYIAQVSPATQGEPEVTIVKRAVGLDGRKLTPRAMKLLQAELDSPCDA
jgi:hypothetical protein